MIEVRFYVKSHNKATFSPVQYCHPTEGGLYPGVVESWDTNKVT